VTLILPQHEQLFPDKLLPHRLEEYVHDGFAPTQDRQAGAKFLIGARVLVAAQAAQASTGLTNIDPRYFVGTCFHEAGCTNEWDTEIATASSPTGFQSVGAYQIGDEEARAYGFQLADMLDFDKATTCMVKLAERNRAALRSYAGIPAGAPDPDYTDPQGTAWAGGTMRAYLAIAHNHGLGYAQLTIRSYGMDWVSYKARNPIDRIVSGGYGEDCVTGGPCWPRILQLATPYMRGADVGSLQRAIRTTTDDVFGPGTEAALKAWQAAHGHEPTGVCDLATWDALVTT
jgi:hypothetical protein